MSEILQGTTPSLEIKIDTNDFLVTDVVKLELVITNGSFISKRGLDDVTVDPSNNSFIYIFTESETLAMAPDRLLYYQLRFMFADDSIVGTAKMSLRVCDLISEDVMTE